MKASSYGVCEARRICAVWLVGLRWYRAHSAQKGCCIGARQQGSALANQMQWGCTVRLLLGRLTGADCLLAKAAISATSSGCKQRHTCVRVYVALLRAFKMCAAEPGHGTTAFLLYACACRWVGVRTLPVAC